MNPRDTSWLSVDDDYDSLFLLFLYSLFNLSERNFINLNEKEIGKEQNKTKPKTYSTQLNQICSSDC